MKRLLFLPLLLIFGLSAYSQEVPSITIKNIDGLNVSTKEIIKNDNKPVLICFWATWCRPCIQELTAFADEYPLWQEEFGLKIVAVSTDNPRSTNRVAPFVNSRGWEFDVYLDPNNDFQRAMNVSNIPHTFLLDANGNIVWQHTSYMPGDEDKVYEQLVLLQEKK